MNNQLTMTFVSFPHQFDFTLMHHNRDSRLAFLFPHKLCSGAYCCKWKHWSLFKTTPMFCSEYMVNTYFCLLSWIFGMLVSFTEGDYTRITFRSSCVLIKRSFIFLLPFITGCSWWNSQRSSSFIGSMWFLPHAAMWVEFHSYPTYLIHFSY